LSRVLGFAREMLIAAALGAGPVADAFYAAFRFPNLFRRLFAEGAFNSAFIPLFARNLEEGGERAAKAFASEVLAALAVILLALTALAEIATPFFVPCSKLQVSLAQPRCGSLLSKATVSSPAALSRSCSAESSRP
jgi:peptidoglycan biosynthesis protein MviN/MurJ (putative lipid II flippase)